jgi:hypothetical protein
MDQLLGPTLALGSSSVHAAPSVATRKWIGATTASKWSGVALLALAGGAAYFGWRASHTAPPPLPTPPPMAAESKPNLAAARVDPPVIAAAMAEPSEAATEEPAPSATRTRNPARVLAHPKAVEATLPAELDLLHDAQSQWRVGNAAGALALLETHRKRFPRAQPVPDEPNRRGARAREALPADYTAFATEDHRRGELRGAVSARRDASGRNTLAPDTA